MVKVDPNSMVRPKSDRSFFFSKNQFWTVQVEHESDWSQQDSSLIGTGRALSNVTSFGWVVWVDPNMTGLKDQRYS